MGRYLTDTQIQAFRRDGFLVVPNFVSDEHCLQLRERAMMLAEKYVPSPEQATVFTADGKPQHTSDDYFLTSGEQIRCFFEKDAFDEHGNLRAQPHLALNKLGHAMHDLDPVFDSFSRTPDLANVAADIGMRDPLLLQSMYIFKQPHIGGEVTCHTDHTYLWTEPQSVVGFWFAIDDATNENGCMWAVPGGHKLPVRSRSRLNESRTATVMDVLDPE
ncbi:MAG: phytanoyl-CoA dioxygenase family protein, partial [Actinomycetota bacterium]